jgi:hypothetical protein
MKYVVIILILCSCTSTKTIGRLEGRVISGNVVRMEWRALNDVKLNSKVGYYTTFQVYRIGTYQFELTGYDSAGNYGKDTVQIQVIK